MKATDYFDWESSTCLYIYSASQEVLSGAFYLLIANSFSVYRLWHVEALQDSAKSQDFTGRHLGQIMTLPLWPWAS